MYFEAKKIFKTLNKTLDFEKKLKIRILNNLLVITKALYYLFHNTFSLKYFLNTETFIN